MNDNEVLAHALHELADDPQVREIPFPAIKARIGRRRHRVQLALVATAAVAVVATVLTLDGVVRGPQVASAPRTPSSVAFSLSAALTKSPTTSPSMSAAARKYLDAALDIMQRRAVNRAKLNWPAIRQRALDTASGA